ncbi:MAG: NAD(P)-dependent alcohol dehydrogenase [Caulobacteraceae bacterium]
MRAAVFDRHGPPEVVRIAEVEKPTPRDDEVLIRVYATTICAPDWRIRGAKPFFVRLITPKSRILGLEFAGRVESVGKDVTRFRPGDDVFGSTGFKFGAHAEYICLPQDHSLLALKPSNMSHEEAAAVLFGGISALYFLRRANVRPRQNVLIYGASGSVGVFAVQLAKHFGAHVTGVCSTANLDMVKALGADEVVDYTRDDFSKSGRIYDVIVDTVGKSRFGQASRALKPGGVFAQVAFLDFWSTLGWIWASMTGAAKVVGGMASNEPGDQALLRDLIEAGQLRTVIDRRYSLDEIMEAHRLAEGGHKKGHVVVLIGP